MDFSLFCEENGITHQTSAPYSLTKWFDGNKE
jgi:hypothetical protein